MYLGTPIHHDLHAGFAVRSVFLLFQKSGGAGIATYGRTQYRNTKCASCSLVAKQTWSFGLAALAARGERGGLGKELECFFSGVSPL